MFWKLEKMKTWTVSKKSFRKLNCAFKIGKRDFKIKKDWDIHWYERISLDVCIHGICKWIKKNETNEKMEKIRVLAISPTGRLWARLPNRKKKEYWHNPTGCLWARKTFIKTFAYINTRSPRLSDLSLFQAWGG